MAHELSFHEGKAEMCYAGARPWHGLGVEVPGLMKTEEALRAAHLSWGLKKERIMAEGDMSFINDAFVIRRDDTLAHLGIVGDRYTPISNAEAFQFFDGVLGEAQAQIETAAALHGGAKVFMLARLPEITEVVKGDIMEQFLLVSTTHDGSSATEVMFTNVRVVCQNTLTAALRGQKNRLKIRHTANYKERMAQAEATLKASKAYWSKYAEMAQHLAATSVSRVEVGAFMDAMFPLKSKEEGNDSRAEKARAKVEALLENGMGTDIPGVKGSAWGLYNAYSEYVQYGRQVNGVTDEAAKTAKRWENIVFGSFGDDLQKALDQCLALAS